MKIRILFDKKTDCWNWNGTRNKIGYGTIVINGKKKYMHRHMYEKTGRKIKKNMTLDHLCMNKRCVNPDHLEEVTVRENIQRYCRKYRPKKIH